MEHKMKNNASEDYNREVILQAASAGLNELEIITVFGFSLGEVVSALKIYEKI